MQRLKYVDPELVKRRRSVHIARAMSASSPQKAGVTTGTIAARMRHSSDELPDENLTGTQQTALLQAFLTRAKLTLKEQLLKQDAMSLDILLDAYKAETMVAIKEEEKRHELVLNSWIKKGQGSQSPELAKARGEEDEQDHEGQVGETTYEVLSTLHEISATTDRTVPLFDIKSVIDIANDLISINRQVARQRSTAATQRRARVGIANYLRQTSLSSTEREIAQSAAAKAESLHATQIFRNDLKLKKGIMDITGNRGILAEDPEKASKDERRLEEALQQRKAEELRLHYEHLSSSIKSEIDSYSGSKASQAVLALEALAGEQGLDALGRCTNSARSGVKFMQETEKILKSRILQSRKHFNDNQNSLLQRRKQMFVNYYSKLIEHIQILIDQQIEKAGIDSSISETLARKQNLDILKNVKRIRERWEQKYSEKYVQHLSRDKNMSERIGNSIIASGIEELSQSILKKKEENANGMLHGPAVRAAELRSLRIDLRAKIQVVDKNFHEKLKSVLKATADTTDAVSKLRQIVTEEKRIQKLVNIKSADSMKNERYALLIAANIALSQAVSEAEHDRSKRLTDILQIGNASRYLDGEECHSSDYIPDVSEEFEVPQPPSPTLLPPPENDGESAGLHSPRSIESGETDWMSPPMAPLPEDDGQAGTGTKWLLQHGFDPLNPQKEAFASWHDDEEHPWLVTPLGEAVFQGDLDICKWLVNHVDGARDDILSIKHSRTSLHLACFGGHVPVIQWLYDNGAKDHVDTVDGCGQTTLHFAIMGHSIHENISTMQWLIKKTTDKNYLVRKADNDGDTPMHVAVLSGALDVCQWLYKNGAAGDLNSADTRGITPIDIAVDNSHEQICIWLASLGVLQRNIEDGTFVKRFAR